MEVRGSSTTTTVLEGRGIDAARAVPRPPRRTMKEDLYTTFSSPMAWVLVLALVITWSAVAIIMFDLLDTRSLEAHTLYCDDPCLPPGPQPGRLRNAFREAGSLRGGIQHMSKDPMKTVDKAMEDSSNWMNAILTFMTNLVAPEEEEQALPLMEDI
uniref:Triadin n=1 Tax=Electrophorus electricus TaxID=8005 RepID=A0A4W4GKG8_ELEEL